MEEVLDHLEEARILGLRDIPQPLRDGKGALHWARGVQLKKKEKYAMMLFGDTVKREGEELADVCSSIH